MSTLSLIKTTLLGITLTLLVPLAAKATVTETWSTGNTNGTDFVNQKWALSNSNLTATSPNTGTKQTATGASGSINGQFGSQAIPLNQKTYFEVKVGSASAPGTGSNVNPWYFLQTAYCVGVGEHGLTIANGNIDLSAEGEIINPATFIMYGYNRGIDNSGYGLSDPEGGVGGHFPPPSPINAPPSFWKPGDVLGFAVDRVSTPNTITFYHNGTPEQGYGENGYGKPNPGTYNISGLAGKEIYPCTESWWLEGPTGTINGGSTSGSTGFAEAVPSGYTGLNTALNGGTPPPPTIPPVPTGLTAGPGPSHVQLNWNTSSGATSYNVKRATVSGGPYTTIASPTTNSDNDTGAANGTTYFYVVSAVNSAGESANSSQVSAIPSTGIPSVPTGLTAASGQNAQVSLSWTASSGATSYKVFRATSSGGPFTTSVGAPTTNSFTDTGLTNGTIYYYEVAAVNSSGTSANSSTVNATPLAASGPVAYWKLDETSGGSSLDSSGNGITGTWENGPIFSATSPIGITIADPGCLSFNGTNQYVTMGDPTILPSGRAARTICGWGKSSSTASGFRWIASYGSPSSGEAMFIGMNGTTLDGGAYETDLTVPNFWDNNWHFIVLTYDGTTANLYADGVLKASAAETWNLVPSQCYIGRQVNSAEYWNGLIDDVRIYNYALSASQVSALVVPPPVAYWKLDETSGGFSLDSSGNGITGTWENAPTFSATVPSNIPVVDPGCLSFNGTNQYVTMGNPTGLPSGRAARTISGWGKSSSTASGYRWIASYGSPSTSETMFIGMQGTTLVGGAWANALTVPNFWDNNWHFIALTYDGTTANLYADGKLVASGAETWNLVLSQCDIGEQIDGTQYWNGLVDDVRIYNYALSSSQISTLY